MPHITLDLLRKRSEHNECILNTLEEISLHQEQLEKIEVIGTHCRKLKILYLQNNIIPRMENLHHLRNLRYLNLALNNIRIIEGLESCEFLEKLDLTVNFIHFDTLKQSIDHLKPRIHLKELYLLGNPCQSTWTDGIIDYVSATLSNLESLDGKRIQRSDRIRALQNIHIRMEEIDERVKELEVSSTNDISSSQAPYASESDGNSLLASKEKVPYTPETRHQMYMEMAQDKEKAQANKNSNAPQQRDVVEEHLTTLSKVRKEELDTPIRQCNQAKYDFQLIDKPNAFQLELSLPKYLDTSLIDVDIQPKYVSIVIKSKVFRLSLPQDIHSDKGTAKRSKVSGALVLELIKVQPSDCICQPTPKLSSKTKKDALLYPIMTQTTKDTPPIIS